MIKRFLPVIFCLSLVLPGYTGSLPGNNPVPGKGSAAAAKKPAEPVLVIRTAPKDAKVDQITLGKNGEILVPQSKTANAGGYAIAAKAPGAPGGAGTPAADKAAEGEEAKTANSRKSAKKAENAGVLADASGSTVGEKDKGFSGNGEDMGGGGLLSGLPGDAGGIPGGLLPSVVTGTTLPEVFFPIDTTTDPDPTTTPVLPGTALQALLEASVSDTGIPGAILAVQTTGGVWTGAAGKADVDANVPMTPNMQVRIAGVTKVFTAALIMKLVEENKIALTDTVQQWLPDLIAPGTVPYSAQITVAMLLNHTSGLYDYVGDQFFTDLLLSDPYYAWPSDSTYDEIIYWIYDTSFLPGTAFEYCNAGYYLLGKIAEAATGNTDTVENMVKTRFFDPLTMSKTTLTRGGQFEATEPYTRGYCWIDPTYYPTLVDIAKLVDTSGWDLSWDWTSGSGVSTAQDMLTWTKSLFGGQVVNAQSLTQMTTPQDPSAFGFGLEVSDHDPWFGEKMYGHGGENPGVVVRWLYYPDSGRTIFLVLNRFDSYAPSQMDVSQAADSILSGVSSILLSASQ